MIKKIKIAIIEPNRIFRLGLKKLLSNEDIEIIGEAADGATGMNLIRKVQPEVILLSMELPDSHEWVVCHWIRRNFPKSKIIALVKYVDTLAVSRLLKTGICGFLTKDSAFLNSEVIKTVAQGKTYLQPDLGLEIVQKQVHPIQQLTDREYQVLTLLASNLTYEEVSEKLSVSVKTIYNTKYRALKKISLKKIEDFKIYVGNKVE